MLKPSTSLTVLFRLLCQTVIVSNDPVWYCLMLNRFHELMIQYENLSLSIVNKPPAICLITSKNSFPVPRKLIDKKKGSINRATGGHTTICAVYLLWSLNIYFYYHILKLCVNEM